MEAAQRQMIVALNECATEVFGRTKELLDLIPKCLATELQSVKILEALCFDTKLALEVIEDTIFQKTV